MSTALASAVAIPLGLLHVVERLRGRAMLRAVDIAVLTLGATCVIATALRAWPVVLGAALGGGIAVVVGGWMQFELSTGDQRYRLLWVVLGVCSSVPTAGLFLVAIDDLSLGEMAVAVILAVLSLLLPLTAADCGSRAGGPALAGRAGGDQRRHRPRRDARPHRRGS